MLRQQLFALLRTALWGVRPDAALFAHCEWSALPELAVQQSVHGLLYDALTQLPAPFSVPDDIKENCLFLMKNTELRNQKLNKQLSSWFKAYGAKCPTMLLMKGQSIATRYPIPLRRVSGDIDLYCFEQSEVQRIDAWARKKNIVVEDFYEKHLVFRCNGVSFENHRALVKLKSSRLDRKFQEIVNQEYNATSQLPTVTIDGIAVRELPGTLYAVYLLVHMAEHFIEEGLGLRQICDWCVFMAKDSHRIDKSAFQKYVDDLGLMPLAHAFGQICVDDLGLSETSLPFALSRNEGNYRLVLNTVFEDGNFGKNLYTWKGEVPKWKDMLMTMHVKMPRYASLYKMWRQEAKCCYLDMIARGIKRISRTVNN